MLKKIKDFLLLDLSKEPTFQGSRILPDFFFSARSLWIFFVLPQLFMLLANLNAGRILWGDMDSESIVSFCVWVSLNIVILIFGALVAGANRRYLSIARSFGLVFLLAFYFSASLYFVPNTFHEVSPWIFSFFGHFFNFILFIAIPSLFLGLRICAFDSKLDLGKSFLISLVSAILVPAFTYLLFLLLSKFRSLPDLLAIIFIAVFSILGFLTCVAVGRVIAISFGAIIREQNKVLRLFLLGLFGMVLPAAYYFYFAINSMEMPFDERFFWGVVLANFLLLLLPIFKSKFPVFLQIFLTGPIYLILSYVMLLFLPFMPLMPFLIVKGIGIVMIAPLVLWLFATLKITKILQAQTKKAPAVGVLVFAMLLPIFAICARDYYYRVELAKALAYVESPDTNSARNFEGDSEAAAKAAIKFLEFKYGDYYPYLTPLEMEILCDSMVVRDSYLERISLLFLNRPLELEISDVKKRSFLNLKTAFMVARTAKTSKTREIKSADFKEEGGNFGKLSLTLAAGKHFYSEFIGNLELPDGVFVSAMSFEIDNVMRKASFVEKRAALWAYQNIVSDLRDPAIAFYKGDNLVSLRAFPINSDLKLELEFAKLSGIENSKFSINGKSFEFKDSPSSNKLLNVYDCGEFFALSPNFKNFNEGDFTELSILPAVILDMSASGAKFEDVENFLRDLDRDYPSVSRVKFYFSNLNFSPFEKIVERGEGGKWNLGRLKVAFDSFKRVGGFDKNLSKLFAEADIAKNFSSSAEFLPSDSVQIIYISNPSKTKELENSKLEPESAIVLRCGDSILQFEKSGIDTLQIVEAKYGDNLEIFKNSKFERLSKDALEMFSDRRDVDMLKLWRLSEKIAANPSLKQSLYAEAAKLSKEMKILSPQTALIVVERKPQEEIMKRAEKKALKSDKNYELTESDLDESDPAEMSEPSEILMAFLALLALIVSGKLAKLMRVRREN